MFNSAIVCLIFILFVSQASSQTHDFKIMTVAGEILSSEMGVTLPHEHILVDFAVIDSIGKNQYDKDSVVKKVLPYLEELKPYQVTTFVDCTPEFLGRDPQLLAELSRKSGMSILTNTGWYAADNKRHLPMAITSMSAEEIARHWIDEARNGIANTGIKPGFIKIGISNSILTDDDKKLVEAACLTHLATGLTIMSHTGPAMGALAQLEILRKYGIDPSAFIWTHAMNEPSMDNFQVVSAKGAWVALDGISKKSAIRIANQIKYLKSIHKLDCVLLSHDAGWYQPGNTGMGKFRPYTELFDTFMLILLGEGITREELDQMMVKNPAEAFGIRIRKAQ